MDEKTYQKLMSRALRKISLHPRSQKEIKSFLFTLEQNAQLIKTVIDRLVEMNYLNDETFAEWVIRSYQGKKAKGKRFIEQILKKHDIDPEIITKLLPVDQTKELESARLLIQKKLSIWDKLPSIIKKNRIQSYLLRRGYSHDSIGPLVDEYVKSAYNTTTEFDTL